MDLSPVEKGLIAFIRLAAIGDMSLSITRASGVVVVTTASPEEGGLMIGAGPTLDAAVFSLMGVEPPGTPGEDEPAPEPVRVLRLVGGTRAPSADDRRCNAVSAA